LTSKLKPLLYVFREKEHAAPTLYLMGQHDSLFLPGIRSLIEKHKQSQLKVIPNCGHVVNIDAPSEFNKICIDFIQSSRK